MHPAEHRTPITLDELITQLVQLRAHHPQQGARFVHLLNMDDDGDGLITDVDIDCFDPQQGPVISLLSGPHAATLPVPGTAVQSSLGVLLARRTTRPRVIPLPQLLPGGHAVRLLSGHMS